MGKIFIILILTIINLYGDFYLDYKTNDGQIKTVELTRTEFNRFENQKEKFGDSLKWYYNNEKYDIINIYETQNLTTQKEEQKTTIKIEETEKKSSYIFLIIIFLIIFIIFKKIKNRKKTNVKTEETEKENNEKDIFFIEETEKEKTEIIAAETEEKTEIKNYEELEKERIEIYKKLKYIKTLDKDKKINLYNKIKSIKENIKNKNEINQIINELKEIEKEF